MSLDGKLRIYFGRSANPTVFHSSGTCVTHHDTAVPNENTTLLPPSHRRRRRAHLRVTTRTDSRNSCVTRWMSTFRHMYASTFMRPCTVWLDSETCSRARHGDPRGVEAAPDLTRPHMFTCSFNVLASSSEDAASLEPTSPSCREDRFRHPCCDHMDECAFQGPSFCCSSHKQIEASQRCCVQYFNFSSWWHAPRFSATAPLTSPPSTAREDRFSRTLQI